MRNLRMKFFDHPWVFKTRRGWYRVTRVPSDVEHIYQRARRGWSDRDTYSMDYTIAQQLDEMFTSFIRHFEVDGHGAPMSFHEAIAEDQLPEEERDAIQDARDQEYITNLKTIRDGFREYHEYANKSSFDFESMEAYMDEDVRTFKNVKKSCTLMGEIFPGLWW